MKHYVLIFLFILFSCSKTDITDFTNSSALNISSITTIGGSMNDAFQATVATLDGGFIAIGHTQSSDFDVATKTNNSFDYWVIKFDENNNIEWSKTFGGSDDDRARSVVQLNDESYIITGFSRSADGDVNANAGNYDFWTIKLDKEGNLLWQRTDGFSGSDQAYALYKTSDGNVLIAGSLDVTASGGQGNAKTSSKHAGGDYWLIKIDTNGNFIWSRYFGGLFTDTVLGIEETTSGNYILAGLSDSNDTDISNNIGDYDFWVVNVSTSGDLVWEKSFGGTEIDEAFALTKTTDGGFLVCGNSRSNDVNVSENLGSSDVWVIKIDASGTLIWEENFGGSSFENSTSITSLNNGNYLLTGSSRSLDGDITENKGNKDILVLKIDENGSLISQKTVGGSNLDEANSVTQLNNGSIVLVGTSQSNDFDINENKGFEDAFIIKIN